MVNSILNFNRISEESLWMDEVARLETLKVAEGPLGRIGGIQANNSEVAQRGDNSNTNNTCSIPRTSNKTTVKDDPTVGANERLETEAPFDLPSHNRDLVPTAFQTTTIKQIP